MHCSSFTEFDARILVVSYKIAGLVFYLFNFVLFVGLNILYG